MNFVIGVFCKPVLFYNSVYGLTWADVTRERVYIIMERVLKGPLVVTEFDCPVVSLFIW